MGRLRVIYGSVGLMGFRALPARLLNACRNQRPKLLGLRA